MSVSSAVSMRTATRSLFPATTIIRLQSRSTRPAASKLTCCPAVDRTAVGKSFNAPPLAGRFLLRTRENEIADCNITRRHYFGIYATIGVVEIFEKRARDGQVADAGIRIDIGRGTALDTLDDLEPHILADRQRLTDKIELMPRGPARNIEVTAKAQRIYDHPCSILHGGH